MHSRKSLLMILVVSLVVLILPTAAMAASVSVECAYTSADLVCYIYADTAGDNLLSAGVKLNYNTDELVNPVASKNEAVWYFGDETAPTPYMEAETTTPGEVTFIVGKLDNAAPLAGVSGARVEIGKVSFDRTTSDVPIVDPIARFGISAGLGRDNATYANFVNTANPSTVLDTSVIFVTPVVVERCDVNASGAITTLDFTYLRAMLRDNSDYAVFADCNGSGTLTTLDFTYLRAKLR